jgi:hypothetical protein
VGIPQRRRGHPTRRRGPHRHARRMDRRRSPLPLRVIHWPSSMTPAILRPSLPSRAAKCRHQGSPQSPPPRGLCPHARSGPLGHKLIEAPPWVDGGSR